MLRAFVGSYQNETLAMPSCKNFSSPHTCFLCTHDSLSNLSCALYMPLSPCLVWSVIWAPLSHLTLSNSQPWHWPRCCLQSVFCDPGSQSEASMQLWWPIRGRDISMQHWPGARIMTKLFEQFSGVMGIMLILSAPAHSTTCWRFSRNVWQITIS